MGGVVRATEARKAVAPSAGGNGGASRPVGGTALWIAGIGTPDWLAKRGRRTFAALADRYLTPERKKPDVIQ
ncbi:hypothetical protein GCM10007884_01540 [Methylobacterium brachythecii]|uniref:Uncharacterized protein n=1 Tax=Methylobacterium brachythecii TaxID=1176177 RepID=A0ABQ6CXA5_9HYPH|nr:hypothetical protein GCM10007884_01540 [Methylobacterium brachythecii]